MSILFLSEDINYRNCLKKDFTSSLAVLLSVLWYAKQCLALLLSFNNHHGGIIIPGTAAAEFVNMFKSGF